MPTEQIEQLLPGVGFADFQLSENPGGVDLHRGHVMVTATREGPRRKK